MSERITEAILEDALGRYKIALDGLELPGISHLESGWTIGLIHGSKHYGNSFKLVWINNSTGGHSPAPGADASGFIGWTKREAYDTLRTITRTLADVSYYSEESK